jgi:hypothetical protein
LFNQKPENNMPFDRVSTSSITPSAEVDNWYTKTPLPKDAEVAIDEVKNTAETIRSSSSSVIGPGSLNYLLHQKNTSPEEIVNKINHEFSLHPQDPGNALNTILNEFKGGNHVHLANFNALLTFLDNGIQNKKESAMQLAINLCRGFEMKEPDLEDKHSIKLLSTLITRKLLAPLEKYPKIKNFINKNHSVLKETNYQRQAKTFKIENMVEKIIPDSQNWEVTPYRFNYKKGLSIETFHFKDEKGHVIEATLIDQHDKKNNINIDNARDIIDKLYGGNISVAVNEIKLDNERGERQPHIVTLFDRTNLVTLNQFIDEQNKQETPWTLDSAAVAYGNKKGKFIAILDTLQNLHTGLAQLHNEKKFRFESYGYLNPETILSDRSGSVTFYDPAPLLIRDIFNQQHLHNIDDAEHIKVKEPMFHEAFLAPAVMGFKPTQKPNVDLYSVGIIWGKMFELDRYTDTKSPFNETLNEMMSPRSKKTCSQLKDDLLMKKVNSLKDVEELCSKRNGETKLIDHVKACQANKEKCQASEELILETAATLLAQYKSTFAKTAQSWSKV